VNATFTAKAWRSAAASKIIGVTYGLRFGHAGRMLVKADQHQFAVNSQRRRKGDSDV